MEAIESMRVSMADNFNILLHFRRRTQNMLSKAKTKAQLQDLRAQIQGVQDKVDGLDVDGRTRRRPA